MSTPVARSYLDERADPLKPVASPGAGADARGEMGDDLSSPPMLPPPTTAPATPLSFKRKTPVRHSSSSTAVRDKAANLIGGILRTGSGGQGDSTSPAFRRPDAPSHITLPRNAVQHKPSISAFSQAIATDDEEEEGEEDDGETTAGESPRKRPMGAFRDRPRRQSASKYTGSRGLGVGNRSRRGTGTAAAYGSSPSKEPAMLSPLWAENPYGDGPAGLGGGDDDQPPDETLLADGGPLDVTPLPKMPIFVLSICMLGEFLSASVCSPFLFFMVESFGVGQDGGGESAVSACTGVVAAVFFLSQFVTSMPWVSIADKHGRRAVLCASLVGNGLTVVAFGTSTNLGTAICTRLAMGVFNGAVGVARSAVQDVTDESNRSLAYTILGLLWGMGGIVGSVLGGVLEHPADKYPSYFGESDLFRTYPYLLPCLVAGSVTLFGGVLSLFLDRNGGQRTGGIHLPTEKDVETAAGVFARFKDFVLIRVRGILQRLPRRPPIQLNQSTGNLSLHSAPGEVPPPVSPGISPAVSPAADEGSERNPLSQRRDSVRQYGSAYGYSQNGRLASQSGFERNSGLRIPSMRRRGYRSVSMATSNRYDPDNEVNHSFAERLLLANNQAVFSLSDVFLAKAAADDQFTAIEAEGSVFERDADEESRIEGTDADANSEYGDVGFGTAPPSMEDLRGEAARQDLERVKDNADVSGHPSRPTSPSYQYPTRRRAGTISPQQERVPSYAPSGSRLRRYSAASSVRPMSIYSNTGLAPESLAASAVQLAGSPGLQQPIESPFAPLQAIPETRAPSIVEHSPAADNETASPSAKSLVWQLPLAMILQYLCVGLHGTACDQLFTSFLVAPIASGGLGLTADHYAMLVAIMFFFSMVWQFKFYPTVGPPNGPLSHLSMFRVGLILYVPVYLLFPELRGLIKVEGETGLVMTGMVVLSALRYLANACAYTAVMVLINVMTPPELVPLANGLAQSCISLARFIGPLLGGSVFAASIADPQNANPAFGFHLIAALCLIGFALSWRIK